MKVCAIIPAHNEAEAIGDIVRGAAEHCAEVIVVDDGSVDRTSTVAEKAGATVLRTGRKSGKGTALRKGFDLALQNGFDAVITIDGDGQHKTEDIPRFILAAQQKDEALVTGSRMGNSEGMPRVRWFINWLTSKSFSVIFNRELRDTQCGFRLIRTDLLGKLELNSQKYDIESEVLWQAYRHGVTACEIPIRTVYRHNVHTHNYKDMIRFLRLYGQHSSRWKGIFGMYRFYAAKAMPVLIQLLKILSFPLLVVAAVFLATRIAGGSLEPQAVRDTLIGMGLLAPVILVALFTIKPLIIFPVSGLTFIAGAVFGLWMGTVWIILGGLVSAVVGFWFARAYGRRTVKRILTSKFPKAEEWVEKEGWTAVLYLRLLNTPWDFVSYAAGLSRLTFGKFMLATGIAVAPVAFTGVLLGSTVWSFPSWEFFGAFGLIFAVGTVTYLVRRQSKLANAD